VRTILAIRNLLSSGRVDLIHAHNGTTALLAAIASRLNGSDPCVFTQHFLEPAHRSRKGPVATLQRAGHLWVNRNTRYFIAVSEAARKQMLARGDASEERVTVVPNGIVAPNPDTLTPSEHVRAELGVAADVPLVVCVARLEPEKDLGVLVDAMIVVARDIPAARCVIAGEGSQRAALQAMLEHTGAGDCVRLLGYRDDALALIRAADLFVLPSPVESSGLVLIEAMALGKPVVATRCGGPMEIVEDGVSGLLVPPSSPEALAEAITRLLRDSDTRTQMGRCGQERYAELFTAEQMARATRGVYVQAARG
jgi:glycosyltransferase involved in cell wall biosynthesis